MKIERVFPRPVIIEDNVCKEDISTLQIFCDEIIRKYSTENVSALGVDSTHLTYDKLHQATELYNLNQAITRQYSFLLMEMGYDGEFVQSCEIKNMWVNKNKKGTKLQSHTHQNSFLSGAYYLESSEHDKLMFFDYFNQNPVPLEPNDISANVKEYPTPTGRMIIFKSDMPHGTNAQQSDSRSVISFNIGIK